MISPRPETVHHLPTRLLNLNPQCGRQYVTLVSTTLLDPRVRYVTLSHCWGQSIPVRLLTSVSQSFEQGISIDLLPRTFREAIQFTRALEINYLWIDALCIVQDSEDDWIRESTLMSSVYSQSWLNLAATSASDCHGGLLRPKNQLLTAPCIIEASWQGFTTGSYLIIDEHAPQRRIDYGPLNQRAWVLQERVLAPRTVHFAYDQVWWDCRHIRASESCPEGVIDYLSLPETGIPLSDTFLDKAPDSPPHGDDVWLACVHEYSKKLLTKDTDKLAAIAGIAAMVQCMFKWSPDAYLAGIWKHSLLGVLPWRTDGHSIKIATYVAPSWSWASVRGNISFPASWDRQEFQTSGLVKVFDTSVACVGGALGPVSRGFLKLEGCLCRIRLSESDLRDSRNPRFRKVHVGAVVLGVSWHEVRLDDDSWYEEGYFCERDTFFCTLKGHATTGPRGDVMAEGLLLERIGEQSGQYRRIGWVRLDWFRELVDALTGGALGSQDYLTKVGTAKYIFTIV